VRSDENINDFAEPCCSKRGFTAARDIGLVERRGRSRRRARGTALSLGKTPNELWSTDYKGEFLLGNHKYCYPLTVTDHASRYLLTCVALSSTKEDYAFTVFERLLKERGLPANIRSDNGVPFACAHALFNLSKFAVWWLRLGIGIERIKPGYPRQNGRHERRHRTLKKEATQPAARNFLQQASKRFTTISGWFVFMNYDLGYFDLETRVLEPLENPFGPKVLPM
jgi:putative transposase